MENENTTNPEEGTEQPVICADCAEEATADRHDNNGQLICEPCSENYHTCEKCEEVTHESDSRYYEHGRDEGFYCTNCFEDKFTTCYHCDHVYNSDNEGRITNNGRNICDTCFEDDYFYCSGCDDAIHNDNYSEDGYCTDCHQPDEDEDTGGINDYSFKPKAIFYGDADEKKHLGIELEVEKGESPMSLGDMAQKTLLTLPETYCKSDGSLTDGFEIVSHPMSYKYIQKNKERLKTALNELQEAKYKSYNTKTCGIHIHISKTAFSTWHLYRFMKFFGENKIFILKLSQRLKEQLERWAKLDDLDKSKIIRKIKDKDTQEDRYQAINLLNDKTVEVRIFRGTLNYNSFMKNIEFIESLYQFTATTPSGKVTLKNYLKYTEVHKNAYSNLSKFLIDHNYNSNKLFTEDSNEN